MNERLKKLRKELELTQQEFAGRLGISRNNIASYETNKSEMGASVISLICREFNVSENWLRDGTGDMFLEQTRDEQIAKFIGGIQSIDDDSFKKRLISMLSEMTEDEWGLLENMVIRLAREKD